MRRHVCWLYFGTLTRRPYFKGALGQEVAGPPMSSPVRCRPDVADSSGGFVEVSAEPHTEPPELSLWLRPLTLLGRCVRTRAEPSLWTTCTLKTSARPWDTCKEVYGASNWKH